MTSSEHNNSRKMLPSVAVLLAAYNGESWISEQIESILQQIDVNVKLYISVDLSTDNTYDMVVSYANKHNEISVLPYGQRFGAAAPNFYHLVVSVPVQKYDYIAFSDQDDIWLSSKIESAINVLQSTCSSGYSGNVTAFWKDGKKKIIKKAFPEAKYDYYFQSPGPGCSFVLTKELACDFSNYLKTHPNLLPCIDWHDWLIYAYARSHNYKWIIDNHSYMLYRQHCNNQLGANSGITALKNRIKSIASGYGIKQTIQTIMYLGMENDSFVSKWYNADTINYWHLSFYAKECRRRTSDKLLFFIACIIMSIVKPKLDLSSPYSSL
jgi:rhamnosyltransferase